MIFSVSKHILISLLVFLSLNLSIMAQSDIGIFSNYNNFSLTTIDQHPVYDAEKNEYHLKFPGEKEKNEYGNFLWKKTTGNFIFDAVVDVEKSQSNKNSKTGLLLTTGLSSNSSYVAGVVYGDGKTALEYRKVKGGEIKLICSPRKNFSILRMERTGNRFVFLAAHRYEPFQKIAEVELNFDSSLQAGIFADKHKAMTNPVEVVFYNVNITIPAPLDFQPYSDKFSGGKIEVLDIENLHRNVIFSSNTLIEAPNWTKDGKSLIFNSGGLLYRIPLSGGKEELINTGFADANNNDHGISPDGKYLAISHHDKNKPAGKNSTIYTLPVTGGQPVKVTEKSPSYWHGWSPNSEFLVYTAMRNEQYNVFKIKKSGGKEQQLTHTPYLDDGPEYTADGSFIYFNSNRSGTMQIWRMKPDGSKQEQVTFDEYNNWFPHPSPDGKYLVFLSYPPDIEFGTHPFYKRVMLRLMSLQGSAPKVIAYLYGGQGTINVPSWSPDSKKIAFVSHSF